MKNLLLVSLDTVRADAVYGGNIKVFDEFLRMGTSFAEVITASTLTPVSHATVFTGLLPARHGIRHLYREQMSKNVTPLASLFKERGFSTGAFVSCAGMDRWYGFSKGFQKYDDAIPNLPDGRRAVESSRMEERGVTYRRGDETLEKTMDWLESIDYSKPFLCFMHLFDAHLPYTPKPPHNERYSHPYYGEVEFTGYLVKKLISYLKEIDQFENTLIVIFSDHGEDLGEHGKPNGIFDYEEGHGALLTDVTLKVPLIMIGPDIPKGKVIYGQFSLVDLCPTILDYFDIFEPYELDGRKLTDAISGKEISPMPAWIETHFPEELEQISGLPPLMGLRYSVQDKMMKIIWNNSGEPVALYDLSSDPGEKSNLIHGNCGWMYNMSIASMPKK